MLKLVLVLYILVLPFYVYGDEFIIGVNERDIYRYKDKSGAWAGKDIDLVNALFRRTSHQFKIISMPWPRVLKALEFGSIDMTLAASISPERRAYALFSNEAFRYSHYMLFAHKSKLSLFESTTELADLAQHKILIGALRGAIYSDSYNELLKKEEFVKRISYIDNDRKLPNFVLKGRVDAYIDSEIEGKYYLLKHDNYSKNIVPLFRITSDKEAMGRLMFSKRTVSQLQVNEFDIALKALHESGEYQQISDKFDLAGIGL